MASASLSKSILRKRYSEKRMALSPEQVALFSEQIFRKFILYFKPIAGQKVHLFLSIERKKEIDTMSFIAYFFRNNIRVFVPKIVGNDLFTVEIFEDTVFEVNSLGIPEPLSDSIIECESFDFVLTPMVYCDPSGNRIGYGKGFYDRFFKNHPNVGSKIGVNYFHPSEIVLDVDANDIPVDYLVTTTEVLSFIGS